MRYESGVRIRLAPLIGPDLVDRKIRLQKDASESVAASIRILRLVFRS